MPFRYIMKDLVDNTPGAAGAIFVDWEGESVSHYSLNMDDTYHLKVIGAHKGVLLNLIHDAQKAVNDHLVKSVTIKMEKYIVLMAPVKDGYLVVMTLKPDSGIARANFGIMRAAEALKKEM